MRLKIHHRTIYRYAVDVILQNHRLVVWPRGSHDLNTVIKSLHFSPPAQIDWAKDVFGNLVATARFTSRARELVITNELTVDQLAAEMVGTLSPVTELTKAKKEAWSVVEPKLM